MSLSLYIYSHMTVTAYQITTHRLFIRPHYWSHVMGNHRFPHKVPVKRKPFSSHPRWGQHGAHLGPVGPRWAPCWPREPCYQGWRHYADRVGWSLHCSVLFHFVLNMWRKKNSMCQNATETDIDMSAGPHHIDQQRTHCKKSQKFKLHVYNSSTI